MRISSSVLSGVPTVRSRASRGSSSGETTNRPSPIPNSWPDQIPRRSSSWKRASGTLAPESTTWRSDGRSRRGPGCGERVVVRVPDETASASARASSGSALDRVRRAEHEGGADGSAAAWTAQVIPALWTTGIRCATRVSWSSRAARRRPRRCTSTRRAAAGSASGVPVVPPESWSTARSSGPTWAWASATPCGPRRRTGPPRGSIERVQDEQVLEGGVTGRDGPAERDEVERQPGLHQVGAAPRTGG